MRGRSIRLSLLAGALVLAGGSTWAENAPRPLRLIGEAPTAEDPAPRRFVIDAEIKPGDAPFQSTVEGWFAALPPASGSGEISGSCVEARCALSADLDDGKIALTGDLAGPAAPSSGRFLVQDDDDKTVGQGAVSFAPAAGVIPDLGELAAPDAVSAAELGELLMWNGSETGFSNLDKDWPDDFEREALATWQAANGRPMTGLILIADLADLRAKTVEAKAAAGWTALGDAAKGWSAGYPAKLLPKARREGTEQRFDSADGKARLVVAIDPPMTEEAFDALFDKIKGGEDGRESLSYTKVNGELEISYRDKGAAVSAVYHNLPGGLARLVFTYPVDQAETYGQFATILPRSFKVTDDLKAQ